MQYELTILDDLVLNKLTPHSNQGCDILEHCYIIAHNSSKEIKNNLVKRSLLLKKRKFISHYIESHQSQLIFLSDFLFDNISLYDKSLDYTFCMPIDLVSCMKSIYLVLEDLLSFMKCNFSKYFNYDFPVPEKSKRIAKRQLRKNIAVIVSATSSCTSKLRLVVLSVYNEFLWKDSSAFTYRYIAYLTEISTELTVLSEKEKADNFEDLLKQKLLSYNFNSWHFFECMVDEIRDSVQAEESLKMQLDKYYLHLKWTNQLYLKSGYILLPHQASIKELLINWISEEISYREKCYQLNQIPVLKEKNAGTFKISTELSVNGIAYLTRLFIDTGVFKTSNRQGLFEILTYHIESKRTENISKGSFGKKYYSKERSTREEVKDVIHKILNEIIKDSN